MILFEMRSSSIIILVLISCLVLFCGAETVEEKIAAADKALKDNKYDDAISLFDSVIEMSPNDYLNYYKRATALLIRSRHQKALSDLGKSLELKPDFIQGRTRRGKLFLSLGDYASARQDFELILKEKPDNSIASEQINIANQAEQAFKIAKSAFEGKDYFAAKEHLNRVIESSSDFLEPRIMRATCNNALRDYNAVLDDTSKALRLRPDSIKALLLRGKAFYFLGQNDVALTHFQQALKYDPDEKEVKAEWKKIKNIEKWTKNAIESLNSGNPAEAIEPLGWALEASSDNPFCSSTTLFISL
eukprot:TRINITY_DN4560_c0_g1_i2.p1 TRINITY_DN4560_c0_g1~~TRINITY_DN4560_c0_g1_i2.p1  ORF type:complete len:303 (+),score=76.69 TRINITY_DN4560_c0_g1_i2:49-957(+)